MTNEGQLMPLKQRRINLPDLAKILAHVFPPASYAKVFYWARTGYLPTYRDPSVKKSHYFVDVNYLETFLEELELEEVEVYYVLNHLNIKPKKQRLKKKA